MSPASASCARDASNALATVIRIRFMKSPRDRFFAASRWLTAILQEMGWQCHGLERRGCRCPCAHRAADCPSQRSLVAWPTSTSGDPMNPNKALWEKGDFTRIADTMRDSGEALVASLGVKPGMKVLDLGCGDGTTAIPAAQPGADVLGVDIARNLVAAGNRRAQEAGPREHPLPGRRCQRPERPAGQDASTSSSASSARCSRRSRSTSRRRWCASPSRAAAS